MTLESIDSVVLTGIRQVLDVGPGKIVSIDPIVPEMFDQVTRFNTEIYLFGHGEGVFTMDFDKTNIISETVFLNGLKRLVYNIDIPDNRRDEHRIECRLAFPGCVSQRMECMTFPDNHYCNRGFDAEKSERMPRESEDPLLASVEDYNWESASEVDGVTPARLYIEYEDQSVPSMDYRGLIFLLLGLGILVARVKSHL